MATLPPDDDEPQPSVVKRAKRAVVAPVERHRALVFLVLAAGAGSVAPDPLGIVTAMACVIAASDLARRK